MLKSTHLSQLTCTGRTINHRHNARSPLLVLMQRRLAVRLSWWFTLTCLALIPTFALAIIELPDLTPRSRCLEARDAGSILTGTWKINGNGTEGDLVVCQKPAGLLAGTMYRDRINGYFSAGEGTAVIVRYFRDPQQREIPIQAFIGRVSQDGQTWSGEFYGLEGVFSGATEMQNVFGFTALRGASNVLTFPPPATRSSGAPTLYSSYTIYNRPKEFGIMQPGKLKVTHGNWTTPAGGGISGTVFDDRFFGFYAHGTGTIAFLRLRNGQNGPQGQVYIGKQDNHIVGHGMLMKGTFYPLTEEMGANESRLTYDWIAVVSGCEGPWVLRERPFICPEPWGDPNTRGSGVR